MFHLAFFTSIAALFAGGEPTKQIHRFTIDGGGVAYSTGGTIELSGTIGQPDAGLMSNRGAQLTGGFWFSIATGDCNLDSGVNASDYVLFPECGTGPDVEYEIGCGCLDFDDDGDLDLGDFALLGNQISGP